jgi:acetyl esterase/lipase
MLGIDPENIIIGGVSAGGHLSAILAQRCHALQIPLKLQILTVPAVDLTGFDETWNLRPDCPYPSYAENAKAPLLPIERMQYFLRHFLGPRMPDPLPVANPSVLSPEVELSPIKGDLGGLAPALVSTADVDMLRDEGEAYARKLEEAGVKVDLKRFMGVPHPFMFMAGALPEAREYVQRCCDAMKAAFGIADRTGN